MYNWIESTFNVSGGVTQAIAVILALGVVLLLFSLFVFVLKRVMGSSVPQTRNRQPRVAVMDTSAVDARRRLVLVRRDNVEHLLLIGGPSDVVVEQNIVRNAPVARHAPNAATAHAAPAQGALKVPTAPGPDIPVKPEEAEPQLGQAQVTGALASSAVRPAAVGSPSPQIKSIVADAGNSRPASRNGIQSQTKAAERKSGPVPDNHPEAPSGSKRASDLLRAATQNGFNRSASTVRSPAADAAHPVAPIEVAPIEEADADTKEKADLGLQPAAPPDAVADNQPKDGATLNTLARAIATRARPSQSNHTITPPASGPAARAKTALLKPVEQPAVERSEPVVSGSPAVSLGEANAGSDASESDEIVLTESDMVSPPAAQIASVPVEEGENASPQTDEALPAPDRGGPIVSLRPDAAEDMPPEPADQQTEDRRSPPGRVEVDLKLGDLLEDTRSEAAAVKPSPEKNVAATPPVAQVQVQSPVHEASRVTAALDIAPGAQRADTGTRVAHGLGDKNPIEDEMAKILHELGGQPNQ